MLGNSGTALATLTNPDSLPRPAAEETLVASILGDVRLAIIQFDDVVDA
jgi:hypothetical protein